MSGDKGDWLGEVFCDYDDTPVRLKFCDGRISDYMPRERAAFIRAFTFSGVQPEIVEDKEATDETD